MREIITRIFDIKIFLRYHAVQQAGIFHTKISLEVHLSFHIATLLNLDSHDVHFW